MDRHTVVSTTLRSIGYHKESETLEVEFQNGNVYQYFGVAQSIYAEFLSAESKGRFFDTHIKYAFLWKKIL